MNTTSSARSSPFRDCHLNPILRLFQFLVIVRIATLLAGCGDPKESARKELAKLGRDFNASSFIDSASNGDKLAVKLFLAAGINVNESAKNETTALMAASSRCDKELVQMLLEKGADPNAQNRDGITALMLATGKCDQQTVEALLESGARPNIQKPDGVTALLIAATAGNAAVVATLLTKGANPNAATVISDVSKGATPLIAASMGQHVGAAKLLLEKGADLNAKDANGFTAADYATNLDLVRLLRQRGAPVVTDYDLKEFLDGFRRDLGSQAKRDMETGMTPDACRKLIAERLTSFTERGFSSNQLFQARTCAFDALASAIQGFALRTVTSEIDSAREKAKPFMALREELGKEIGMP